MKILFYYLLSVLVACQPAFAQQAVGKVVEGTIFPGTSMFANYVKNPSGHKNALNITTSNASIARDVTGASDLVDGKSSLVCDASAQNGYCQWTNDTIAEGDKTGNCQGFLIYKGDASLYKMQIYDGSSAVHSSSVLTNASDWQEVALNYPCAATRNIRFTQTEAGTGAAVNIARVYWGKATNIAALSPITAWASYTPTFTGFGTVTNIEVQWRRNGPDIELRGKFTPGTTTVTEARISLPNGLTSDSTASIPSIQAIGKYVYNNTAATTVKQGVVLIEPSTAYVTFSLDDYNTAIGPFTKQNGSTLFSTGVTTEIYNVKFPIAGWSTQTVYNANADAWFIDAILTGANMSLGGANISSYTEMTNAGLTLTPTTGSAPVGVMCSTTNAAATPSTSSTTCSAGSESNGINFFAEAGVYEVCFEGAYQTSLDTAEAVNAAFQIIETPTNAQTLTLEGGGKINSGGTALNIASGVDQIYADGFRTCANFKWTDQAKVRGVRLMYEQLVSGTIDGSNVLADANVNIGQRVPKWSVRQVAGSIPAPLLVGSVSSNTTGLERMERLIVDADCAATPCTITSQSGAWASSVSRSGIGSYTVNIASGIFSAAPTCVPAAKPNATGETMARMGSTTTSTATLNTYDSNGGSLIDSGFHILCMGPR